MSRDMESRRQFVTGALLTGGATGALASSMGAFASDATGEAAHVPSTQSRIYNVRAFGAKGDGLTDDTDAVQAALDAAAKALGARVQFPAGRYRLTHSVGLASSERIDITGDGLSSVLLYEADEPALLWLENAPCRESSIRNLCFTAAGADKSPGTPAVACLGGAERCFFLHLMFNGGPAKMGSGLVVEKVMDTVTLEFCQMCGVTGTGLKVAKGSEVRLVGGRIIGNDRYSEKSIGLHLTGNNGGVHVITTDLIGLETAMKIGEPGNVSNREVFITHATFDSSVHGLVQVDNAYTSIAGCWAASSDEEQILVDASAPGAILSISGGTIFNGGANKKGGANNGLVMRAGSFMLTGVTVRNNLGTGILVDTDRISNYTVTGCRIAENGVGAVLNGNQYAFTGNVLARNTTHLADNGGPNKIVANNVTDSHWIL